MKLHASLSLGLALLSLFLGACHYGALPGALSVAVVNFKPLDATLLESRAIVTLRYTNEGITAFGLSGSKHKLYLNGKYVGTAVSDQPLGIPPLQTTTQDVTINFENLALVRQLMAAGESQKISYRLESVLYQTINEDKYQNKVDSTGVLDLQALGAAAHP
jgi:LEA14-like dessication related protein